MKYFISSHTLLCVELGCCRAVRCLAGSIFRPRSCDSEHDYLLTKKAWWLAVAQNLLHLAYILTWERSSWTRRVLSWSSLEWQESRLQYGLIFGTSFDIATHMYYAVQLSRLLSINVVAVVWIGALLTVYQQIFWSNSEWRKPHNAENTAKTLD